MLHLFDGVDSVPSCRGASLRTRPGPGWTKIQTCARTARVHLALDWATAVAVDVAVAGVVVGAVAGHLRPYYNANKSFLGAV